ncbi:VirK/YbjX family protein [Leptothrix discophora]|uniref:DUF535 family protein n=1 Tax=Leptothrix discophora TaxID=89 RepID=A0ABT9G8K2_LEPDI|nr:DUF535 family protein [Leptothrix discophora]MDP4302809.1 DUF535 family protein [Leptothrix discophora]
MLHLLDAARHPRPGSGSPGPQRVATHFLRCLRHLDTFRRWYGDDGNPALQRELAARPYLVTCVVHPYLHGGWHPERRLEVIRTHYSLMRGALALLHAPGPAWLAGTAEGLHLRLDRPGKFEHEGESTLHLCQGEDTLYSIAFTLGLSEATPLAASAPSGLLAYVGALQGLHDPAALERYRHLTHQLHGLRPRDLLLTAFRLLCTSLGVARILAVGNAQRVSSNRHYAASDQVHASYDEAWQDAGGTETAEGFFELASCPVRRSPDQVPVRKRALYRRRYELLDALARDIAHGVRQRTP